MNLALNSFERQRDLGLFVLRVTLGGTCIFYGWDKLADDPRTWTHLGATMDLLGIGGGHLYWGMAATFAELLGGLFLVLGVLVRLSAIALCGTMFMATLLQWQSLRWGTMASVREFFYPLTLAAVTFALSFLGGGRFGREGGGAGGGGGRGAAASKEK